MNAALVTQALEIIPNTSILVNLVSRRVRQLKAGVGPESRTLLGERANLSTADIALTELIEGKMSFDMPEIIPLVRPNGKDKHRPKGWINT
jgi:DNA-directed RNA polymerase subunit K/omega